MNLYTTPFYIHNLNSNSIRINFLKSSASAPTLTIEYTDDNITWQTLGTTTASSDTTAHILLAPNKLRYFRCTTDSWSSVSGDTFYSNTITCSGLFEVGGNIMSLLYGANFTGHEKTFPNDNVRGIFNRLFYNNTNLYNAEKLVLPVTHTTSDSGELARSCYKGLFEQCSNLLNGPFIALRARDNDGPDVSYALYRMFYGCTSLKTVKTCLQTGAYRYNNTFTNPSSSGIIYNYSGKSLTPGSSMPSSGWTDKHMISMYINYDRVCDIDSIALGRIMQIDDTQNTIYSFADSKTDLKYEPFYLENTGTSAKTATIKKNNSNAPTLTIQKSSDKINWTNVGTTSTTALSISVPAKSKVYLRCDTTAWAIYDNGNNYYNTISYSEIVGGNTMSLLYGSNFTGEETTLRQNRSFRSLFYNSSITDASHLLLPATTLIRADYHSMFSGCGSLKSVPELPAVDLSPYCYASMFSNCSLLTYPQRELPATNLASYCYDNMYNGCSELIQSPILPAMNLVEYCYRYLFRNCTHLAKIWCNAVDNINVNGSTTDWVNGVGTGSSGIFYKNQAVTWETGNNAVPNLWTVIDYWN